VAQSVLRYPRAEKSPAWEVDSRRSLLMMTIQLIGVPFDGMGRPGGQARAPIALRAAGLPKALRHREVLVGPDVAVPIPLAERSNSGLLNEVALLEMIEALYAVVFEALSNHRFPLVYGADCSVLLAVVP